VDTKAVLVRKIDKAILPPDSIKKEYGQIVSTPFAFRQVKPALWKTPLRETFFIGLKEIRL